MALLLALLLADAGRALALLQYIAGDYETAVSPRGEVISAQEWTEQAGFARDAAQEAPQIGAEIEKLAARIDAHAPPPDVVPVARELALLLSQKYRLSMLPPRAPDLRQGRALYRQACAACHGAMGTPATQRLELSTQPTAFASRAEIARLSPQRIYAAVTYGVPGTAMPSYADSIPEAQRWDLAYATLLFGHADRAERRRGEEILRKFPRRPDWLQLAVRSDDQLRRALGGSGMSEADREAVLTAIRSAWSERVEHVAGAPR